MLAGEFSCRDLRQFLTGYIIRYGWRHCGEDDISRLLDHFQAFGQHRSVAVIKLNVVR